MIVNKDETSQIKTDEPTTSSLLTVEPSTDAARQETVDVNRVINDTCSENNTMQTTAMTQHVSAASTQVGSQPKLNAQYVNRYLNALIYLDSCI